MLENFRSTGRGALLGVMTSIIVMFLAYLVSSIVPGLVFPPFSLFDFITRVTPGAIVTFVIDFMVNTITTLNLGSTSEVAKLAEQSMAIILFLIVGGLFGAFLGTLEGRKKHRGTGSIGLLTGLGLSLAYILIELYLNILGRSIVINVAWILFLFAIWGWVLDWLVRGAISDEIGGEEKKISRREAIYLGGTTIAAILVSASGLGFLLSNRRSGESDSGAKKIPTLLSRKELEDRISPAPGNRPEVTANDDFYRIDINTMPPRIDEQIWRLELGGLVKNPMSLTLEDIRTRQALSEYITITCISNPLGGDLISTSYWTGISLLELLEEAVLLPEAQELAIESLDGFYESVSMEDMLDPRTLLVYEMNAEPLPVEHGFPLRIYIPNHYGMKQPKWITKMTVIDHQGDGYWVDRGWSEEAIVRTTSVIDNVVVDKIKGVGLVSGGIAFAGSRSIDKVEVRINEGSWEEAELISPPLSPLTWMQWRYQIDSPQAGEHFIEVRAYDGNGELQIVEENEPHPEGATGIDRFPFNVE